MAEFGKLPEWYGSVQFMGGSGLVSANTNSHHIIEVRTRILCGECYVKMSNGVFHTTMGMIEDLVVSDVESGYQRRKSRCFN